MKELTIEILKENLRTLKNNTFLEYFSGKNDDFVSFQISKEEESYWYYSQFHDDSIL